MHEVIVCEKPTSAEKIAKALSPSAKKKTYNKKVKYWELKKDSKDITVVSAVGHLYSLTPNNPKDKVYFDLHWAPAYEVNKKGSGFTKDYVRAIKKLAKGADSYIHACDYDTEGTLIGYNAIKYACEQDSLANVSRMKFSTLTKKDLLEAYDNRIDLDMNQVDMGIARHVLDYYFGVNVSKALMKSVRTAKHRFLKLSAGRVQTPTLSILVERENEIKNFVPEPYWLIRALIDGPNDEHIEINHVDGKIFDKNRAEEIMEKCKGKDATVDKITLSKSKTQPPVPFNLGGLQSEAYNVFGFSPKKTQVIAQNLYTSGYTSYPRTSSQKLPESLNFKDIFSQLSNDNEFNQHISQLPSKLKPNNGKKDDAAHPAIHPTGILPQGLSKDDRKIYNLIVYRFISVFFESAEFETMSTTLDIEGEKFRFRRRRVTHKGWMEHYPYRNIDNEEFPDINEGDLVKVLKLISDEKETKPPARYNQASLVKELEKRELGTKATRADIIDKLYDRKYITGDKQIEVNQLGTNMVDTLSTYCKDLTSEELTRAFENRLEGIENNTSSKTEVIKDGRKEVSIILGDIEQNSNEIGNKLYESYQESNIVGVCPDCGGNLVKRYSPKTKSYFVGCSNYPDCTTIYSIPKGTNFLKKKCEKCGLPIISFGKPRQRACLDPNCGKEKTKPHKPEEVGECPECGKPLLKRSGRYGEFIGCKGFPKCRFTCSVEELEYKLK
jgi:DNA topoisomerase-1